MYYMIYGLELMSLGDLVSRLGKSGSPKLDSYVPCVFWAWNLIQARSFVSLSELESRSGKKVSPKRDIVTNFNVLLAL